MTQPPSEIDSTSYTCIGCGYDLSGSAIGGDCPECGASVKQSLRVAQDREQSGNSSSATICLVLGIIGVTACGLVAPFAIWQYYRVRDEVARGVASPGSMGMAKAGLVLGWVGTAFLLLTCVIWGGLLAVEM